MNSVRLTYVDTAKCLAIYFVIVSHCSMSSSIAHFLFAFHVPIFFLLYGYVYKGKNIAVREYLSGGVVRMVYRILIPYLLLSFILGDKLSLKSMIPVCYGAIQSLAYTTSTHLWFLPCYFISVVLFNLIDIVVKNKKIVLLLIIIMSIISLYCNYTNLLVVNVMDCHFHLTGNGAPTRNNYYIGMPFAINVAFTGILFIYCGTLIRKFHDRCFILFQKRVSLFVIVICTVIGWYFYKINDGDSKLVAMSLANYGNYFYFVVSAICLSYATLHLSYLIDNKYFAKNGKNSFPIYAFHLSLVFVGNKLYSLLPMFLRDSVEIKAIFVGTITFLLSCAAIPFIKKIDPSLIGEHK